MSGFVIDASTTLSWFFKDESDPRAEAARHRLAEDRVFVPQLWHLEVRNALLMAERRKRITANRVTECLTMLSQLPIGTDGDVDLASALTLARAHRLTLYDAVYLELARRRELPLVTLDSDLNAAAQALGLAAFGA